MPKDEGGQSRLSYKGSEGNKMNGRNRSDIKPGLEVNIVLKKDQRSGNLTEGIVKNILTNAPFHPHGDMDIGQILINHITTPL
jgi:uncharacterized repeat protein (TIGR03833 family)